MQLYESLPHAEDLIAPGAVALIASRCMRKYERKSLLTARVPKGTRAFRVCVSLYGQHMRILESVCQELNISFSTAIRSLLELQGSRGLLGEAWLARLRATLRLGESCQTEKTNENTTAPVA